MTNLRLAFAVAVSHVVLMTESRPLQRVPLGSEARLLYTLLDAAHADGLFPDAALIERWRAIEARLKEHNRYFEEADAMHALLAELDASDALAGTWIQERWRSAQTRASKPPF